MSRTSRTAKPIVMFALLCALVAPASSASADGLPIPVEDVGPTGVPGPDEVFRYVSVPVDDQTLVVRTVQDGGTISRSTLIEGRYTIPAVGIDGSPGGLSHDGETLVLIRPRPSFPRDTTDFVVLNTRRLEVRDRITLGGDFSFDALSPDGSTMYLIHYLSRRDATEYEVRAYDLARGELVPGKIVDPNESNEEMYGYALSRETSPDGTWAYTLYYGREHPFIHALDTVRGAALCIDLDTMQHVRNMSKLGLEASEDGGSLVVSRRGTPLATVDTATFEVEPAEPAASTEAEPELESTDAEDEDGWVAWAAIGGGFAALAATLVFIPRHRRLGKGGSDQRE